MKSIFSILLFLLANTTAGYLTPNPPGKYNVTLTTGPLTDHSRSKPRKLMLSVFQPAECASTLPVSYMPEKTAKYQGRFLQEVFGISQNLSPLFLEAQLPVCPGHAADCMTLKDVPILLFTPGYSIPRLYYSVLASAIASEGFIVITIDDPKDANIITYPDGYAVYNDDLSQTNAAFKKALPDRVTDISFVIDQLGNATAMAELLPERGHQPFSTGRIAALGHSLGGVASVLSAGQDQRVRGAVNWDGSFVTLPPKSGVSKPVLLMSHGYADDSWPKAWPRLEGPKLWVNVADTTHETFSDIPTLLKAAGQESKAFETLLGSIEPAEMERILVAYTTTWLKGVFAGKEAAPLLHEKKPSKFPEVVTVRKANL